VSDIIVIQPDENNVVVSEITNSITTASDGPQGPAGPTGATGATGATGPAGSSGVVAVTAPITNSGTSSSANIGISAGTTSAAGALQLTDSVASTSTTTAATPNAVKTAYDLAIINPQLKQVSGTYRTTLVNAGITGLTVARFYNVYIPFFVPEATTFDRIAMRSVTVTGTPLVRLGIYTNANGLPSTLVLDAGTVSVTSSGTTFQITISSTLQAGFYWLAFNHQSAASNFTTFAAINPTAANQNGYIMGNSGPGNTYYGGYQEGPGFTGGLPATANSTGTLIPDALAIGLWLRAV
jgi:hypothetical protein